MESGVEPRRQMVLEARDRRRRFLPEDEIPVSDALAGGSVYLTIDQRIQASLEEALIERGEISRLRQAPAWCSTPRPARC